MKSLNKRNKKEHAGLLNRCCCILQVKRRVKHEVIGDACYYSEKCKVSPLSDACALRNSPVMSSIPVCILLETFEAVQPMLAWR